MLRTVLWFSYGILYTIGTVVFLPYYYYLIWRGQQEKAQKFVHTVSKNWSRRLIRATSSKVTIIGIDNIPKDRTILFVSNHQGDFDIPLLLGFLPISVGFVAKVELQKLPIISIWMNHLHCVFLDRKNPKQSVKAILQGIENLKNGFSMVVFPEGTRSKGKKMKDFKAGSMKLALKAGVPIVPITIHGTYKLLEEKKAICPGHIILTIHPVIEVDGLSSEEQKQLHTKVQKRIESAL